MMTLTHLRQNRVSYTNFPENFWKLLEPFPESLKLTC